MECEQLNRLIKEWYLQKIHETLAPARMMDFIDQHIKNCPVCAKDLLLPDEVEKIREFIFPESKLVTSIQVDSEDEADGDANLDEDEFIDAGAEDDEPEEDDEDEI